MEEEVLLSGLKRLKYLSKIEYRENLSEVLSNPKDNVDDRITRIGRLMGVELKQPFALAKREEKPSYTTRAYRTWRLKKKKTFAKQKYTWQHRVLESLLEDQRIVNELQTMGYSLETYSVVEAAQSEGGFWGYLAEVCRDYICQDKKIREKIEENIKAVKKSGINIELATPEIIVGSGGLALGGFLIQSIPILGLVGAPIIAGFILILYKLGIEAFCRWSKQFGVSNAYQENTG